MSNEAQQRAARDARATEELVAAIERCWRTKFGNVSVMAEVALAKLRGAR